MEQMSVILLKRVLHHRCFFCEFGEFLRATIQRNNTRNILDDYVLFLEYLWSIFGPQTLKTS